jgi:hypothetical protein
MVSAEPLPLSLAVGMPRSARGRLQSVDALRGGVMIIMALDHVRDFISSAAMSFSPTDLSRTTASLFLPAGSLISALPCSPSRLVSEHSSGCGGTVRKPNCRASW